LDKGDWEDSRGGILKDHRKIGEIQTENSVYSVISVDIVEGFHNVIFRKPLFISKLMKLAPDMHLMRSILKPPMNILHIYSSTRSEGSHSYELAHALFEQLDAEGHDIQRDTLNLWEANLPAVDDRFLSIKTKAASGEDLSLIHISEPTRPY